ncbi:hypothetical protein Drorol1_Dr00008548 [Drosera rotundifolia]
MDEILDHFQHRLDHQSKFFQFPSNIFLHINDSLNRTLNLCIHLLSNCGYNLIHLGYCRCHLLLNNLFNRSPVSIRELRCNGHLTIRGGGYIHYSV